MRPVDLAEDGFDIHTANERMPIAALHPQRGLVRADLQALVQADTAPKRE